MPGYGLIPGGRQELTEAISGLGEGANLETQRNIADNNLAQMERAREMNMMGTGAGMALAVGPKAYNWLSKAWPTTPGSPTDLGAASDAVNSGAIGGNIGGTPASALAGDQFAPAASGAIPGLSSGAAGIGATAAEGGAEAAAPLFTGATAGAPAFAALGGEGLAGAAGGVGAAAGEAGADLGIAGLGAAADAGAAAAGIGAAGASDAIADTAAFLLLL